MVGGQPARTPSLAGVIQTLHLRYTESPGLGVTHLLQLGQGLDSSNLTAMVMLVQSHRTPERCYRCMRVSLSGQPGGTLPDESLNVSYVISVIPNELNVLLSAFKTGITQYKR